MIEFTQAPEVAEVAEAVISTYPLDSKISEAKIVYLFVLRKKWHVTGKIQRPGGAWRYLSDYNYVVLIHKSSWDSFTPLQREALVCHELRHVSHKLNKEGKIIWRLRDHDVEEFLDIVENFGYWNPQLEALSKIEPRT